ncbi:RDD family protein [Ureaplasma diversum]|uniref:RDD family protein n=1 Tax=Ureaplasma diversum TaxID=42094 RepID=UPI000A782073|nr:RDD family protein [Ureaplasma diversum]
MSLDDSQPITVTNDELIENKQQQEEEEEEEEYEPARALKRFGVAFCDFLFVSLICFCIVFLFFINSAFSIKDLFSKLDPNNIKTPEPWRIFMITVSSFIIYNLYFWIIPLFNKGRTLFKMIFKLRVISTIKQNCTKTLALALFKHNLLTWFIFMLISLLITSFTFIFKDNPKLYLEFVQSSISLSSSKNTSSTLVEILSVLTKSLYSITGLISSVVLIHMFMNSKKTALHDQIAKVVVLDLTKEPTYKKPTNPDNPLKKHNNLKQFATELDKINNK